MKLNNVAEDRVKIVSVGEDTDSNVYEQAWNLVKDSNINILRNKELTSVATINNKVVASLFTSWDSNGVFSFDVIVSPKWQRQGIASQLIDDALSEFNMNSEYYDEPKIEVDVVNPNLINHFKKRGFEIINQINNHTIMIKIQ